MRLSRRHRFLGPGESLLGNKTPGVSISEAVSQQTPSDRCAEENDQEPGSEDTRRAKPAADSWDGPTPHLHVGGGRRQRERLAKARSQLGSKALRYRWALEVRKQDADPPTALQSA